MTHRAFTIRVTARRTPSNEVEGDGWFDPQDFIGFLQERFTVPDDAPYGLDAYSKHAPQLISSVELVSEPPPATLSLIKCIFCHRVIHMDGAGVWRDSTNLTRCDETDGNHAA